MERAELPQLTHVELAVMKVLWRRGRLSAREVHDLLGADFDWASSTTRTTLDRMVRKGLLDKRAFHGIHLYVPLISRAEGIARMVRDFASEVLEIGPLPVVSLFSESGGLDESEVAELRQLLEAHSEEER